MATLVLLVLFFGSLLDLVQTDLLDLFPHFLCHRSHRLLEEGAVARPTHILWTTQNGFGELDPSCDLVPSPNLVQFCFASVVFSNWRIL